MLSGLLRNFPTELRNSEGNSIGESLFSTTSSLSQIIFFGNSFYLDILKKDINALIICNLKLALHSVSSLQVLQCSSCTLLCRGMQASKNKNREKPEPFYRLSVTKQKSSSEIINEARNVLRTLRTQRPFTPTENQRKLFGSRSSLAPQNRPPSVFRYSDFKIFQIFLSSKRSDSQIMFLVIFSCVSLYP